MIVFKNIDILDENFELRQNVSVRVEGSLIKEISSEPFKPKEGERVIEGKDRVLIPGFVNAHAHSPMSLMRGYGENMSLQDWLFKRIFPFEDKLNSEAVYYGTLLSMAESFKYGIVSTSDMYYFVDDIVRAVVESGAKANISRSITNPSGEPFDSLSSVKEAEEVASKYHMLADGRIRIDHSLHAEYTSNEETATRLAEIVKNAGLNMHVHVSETKREHEECKLRHEGRSPVRYLADCGIFDVRATAAHCIWIDASDFDILREKGVTVATNPVSNLKLASGICDVESLLRNNINVAIGTDSSASNNNLNMLEEIKTMTILAKVKQSDPTVISPAQALKMASFNGSIAQGREDCGRIKEENRADLVMIRTDSPNMFPRHNILNNLVFSATDSDIAMTMVDGKIVYENGEFTTIDVEKTAFEVEKNVAKIMSQL